MFNHRECSLCQDETGHVEAAVDSTITVRCFFARHRSKDGSIAIAIAIQPSGPAYILSRTEVKRVTTQLSRTLML